MAAHPVQLDAETYDHLRRIAARIFAERGRDEATLQPTALLHEAWVKVERSSGVYQDRAHFMAVASQAMRQILVDRARARRANKRGGGAVRTTLAGLSATDPSPLDLLQVDQVLTELAHHDAALARLLELRLFGGLEFREIAEALDVSEATVYRRWRFARAWLTRELG